MTGGEIGRVTASADPPLAASFCTSSTGATSPEASQFRVVDETPDAPQSLRLGIPGMTGLTAYVGLTIAGMTEGDAVFSGAAGAVGSAAGRIARLLGAGRVVGLQARARRSPC